MNQILFTGGSGLLGSELQKLFSNAVFPIKSQFDVENIWIMKEYISKNNLNISKLVHMAAFISPPVVEKNPLLALNVNIVGTANVVRLCAQLGCKLIYISTDYVFNGEKGNYSEEDPMYPVNKYSWSKLGGECAVRLYDNHVIIRTTFGPNEHPYDKAPDDQLTSREKISIIAPKIAKVIESDFTGTIHVGHPVARTVYDYAVEISPSKNISRMKREDMNISTPRDTSLNTNKFKELFGGSN